MLGSTPIKPFRWNLAKREQLGDLFAVPAAKMDSGFSEHLRTAAARVLAHHINMGDWLPDKREEGAGRMLYYWVVGAP